MRHDNSRWGRGLSVLGLGAAGVAVALVSALSPAIVSGQATEAPRGAQAPPAPKPAAPRQGAAPAQALPSARTVIDRHIAAIGGRKAILAHTSTHASGTMSMASSGVSGTVDVFAARPNKSFVKLTLGGIGEVLEGFDGTVGWSLSAITGPMLALGKELEQKKFDAAYDADLHDSSRYKSMQTVEQTTFDGHPVYRLTLVHLDGSEDTEYYDVQTRLKVATIATRESPMGPVKVTISYGDYKKFGDLLVPASMKQSTMGVQQVLTFTSVEFDTVPSSVFEPPDAIKALIK
jgi:zinc protease